MFDPKKRRSLPFSNYLSLFQAGSITDVAVTRYGDDKVVTSVRDGSGNLRVIAWTINSKGSIDRKESSDVQANVAAISMDKSFSNSYAHLYTGIRLNSGALKVITWFDNFQGPKIDRLMDGDGGTIYDMDTTFLYEKGLIITTVKTASTNLKLISWSFPQVP